MHSLSEGLEWAGREERELLEEVDEGMRCSKKEKNKKKKYLFRKTRMLGPMMLVGLRLANGRELNSCIPTRIHPSRAVSLTAVVLSLSFSLSQVRMAPGQVLHSIPHKVPIVDGVGEDKNPSLAGWGW
jgi:hypothetical protein